MHTNTYIVTIYTHDRPDAVDHSNQVWDVLAESIEGFGAKGKINGFDVFVEEPRRWTLLTRRVNVARPVFWLSRLIRSAVVAL